VTHNPDDDVSVGQLIERARSAEREGKYSLARSLYYRGLQRIRTSDDSVFAAPLMRWIGMTHRHEGDVDAAHDCYTASLTVAELGQDPLNQAYALNSMGNLLIQRGELSEAEDIFAHSRRIAESIGEARLLAMVAQNQGVIANIRGELESALGFYNDSLSIYREHGEHQHLGQLLNNLGMIYTDLRQWDQAQQAFEEALIECTTANDLSTQVLVQVNLAELYLVQKDLNRARESCDAAFELAQRLDYHLGLGEVYKWYGVIYRETGKFRLAEAHLRSAADIAEKHSSPLLTAEVERELAEVYMALERNRDALLSLNRSQRVFNSLRADLDVADVERRLRDLEDIFSAVVRKWAESIESKDRYTAGHCERVADYSTALARVVGFDEQTLTWFRMGAFLHDVGKTAIPEEILNKEGKLTQDEWQLMKEHTVRGVELLSPIDFPWDIRPMVRSHHERWDGTGYPDGLAGRQIPLSARILCVADVFDALTTTRSYRKAYTTAEALKIMNTDVGVIFDPELLALFETFIVKGLSTSNVVLEPPIVPSAVLPTD
jgi:putative nucleotidyltransferase with HDIG domain